MVHRNGSVWLEFRQFVSANQKQKRAACKHCNHEMVSQAGRCLTHLGSCKAYQIHLTSLQNTQDPSQPAQTPPTIDLYTHRCNPIDQLTHDQRLAFALFAGGLPFHTFDQQRYPKMWEFIHHLNRAYKILNRKKVSQKFLPKCYYDTAKKVHKVLQSIQYLNFVTDESDDKAKRRICNLTVNILPHGSFFVKNYHIQIES